MNILQSIFLGFLQGVSEFLPISSSGHLQIAQELIGFKDIPLLFSLFLHLSTLVAVCIFFWKKIWSLLKCFGRWISKKEKKSEEPDLENDVLCRTEKAGRKTIIAIIISTIITGAIGIVTSKFIPELPSKFVACGFLVTAILLIVSSIYEKKTSSKTNASNSEGVSVKQSIFVGIMQGIGTLPGISRSGSTISGALFSKMDRKTAGDYSFIISIPAIIGGFILDLKDIGQVSEKIGVLPVIISCLTAFIVGLLSLKFFMKLIQKGKLVWFAAYLIPAGILGLLFL